MQGEASTAQLVIRPTRFTLYLRRSLLWQLWRFVVINVRMLVMIFKSHPARVGHETRGGAAPLHAVVKSSEASAARH